MEMADEGAASTLILVGAILQLLFMLGYGVLAGFFLVGTALIAYGDPNNPILGFGWSMFGLFTILTVVTLFLMIVWFIWRSQPSKHRAALITTGVIGLFPLFIPGILVIVAGAIAPKPEEVPQPRYIPAPPRQHTGVPGSYCGYCGALIRNPEARFCETCGAQRT